MNEKYNHDIAIIRIDKYIDKILEYAKIFNINDFHLSHMGDITENIYMHKNTQAFNAEFTFSEQIVKAIELFVYLINKLSYYGKVTFYGVVRGNHGRMSDKKETLSKDCAEYIIHEGVKSIINNSNNRNIVICDNEYNIERVMMTIQNHRIKVIHGDAESQNDRDKIQKHISLENEIIDILCLGHFHNFQIKTENHNRIVFASGCLQGSTDYGESLKYSTPASQGIIILSENETIPININL
jgi:predicted phosphodiesterase